MNELLTLAMANDPSLLTKAMLALDTFDWQKELDDDPGYDEWLENAAMMFNYSHARMPGE